MDENGRLRTGDTPMVHSECGESNVAASVDLALAWHLSIVSCFNLMRLQIVAIFAISFAEPLRVVHDTTLDAMRRSVVPTSSRALCQSTYSPYMDR